MDTLKKFSENFIDVNENLGWWCHIPKIGRALSPELQRRSPRSRSSPYLLSGTASPERRASDQPRTGQVLPVAYLDRTLLRSAEAERFSERKWPSAQFALQPPAEPLTLLGGTWPLYNDSHAHERRDKAAWGVFQQGAASLALCDEEPMWLTPRLARQPRPRAQRARRTTAREPGGARRAVRGLLRKLIASLPLPSQTTSHECCTDETVMQTGNVGEAKPPARKDGWMGGVRALRDSHVRLVLKQLRHIERLNRALDQAAPKH